MEKRKLFRAGFGSVLACPGLIEPFLFPKRYATIWRRTIKTNETKVKTMPGVIVLFSKASSSHRSIDGYISARIIWIIRKETNENKPTRKI
jgi:hypothetical protein